MRTNRFAIRHMLKQSGAIFGFGGERAIVLSVAGSGRSLGNELDRLVGDNIPGYLEMEQHVSLLRTDSTLPSRNYSV